MTNVLVISGSRNPEGQTAAAIQALLRGAEKAGSIGGAPLSIGALERIVSRCGFDVLDMVAVGRQNREFKQKVLEMTGEWLVTG